MVEEYSGKWQASEMKCDACAFDWIAVHPVVAEYAECPICSHMNPTPFVEEEMEK